MMIWKFKINFFKVAYFTSIFFLTYIIMINYKDSYSFTYTIEYYLSELYFMFDNEKYSLVDKIMTFFPLVILINIYSVFDLNKYSMNYNRFILYRVVNVKELMKSRYKIIILDNITSVVMFIISLYIIGYKFSLDGVKFDFTLDTISFVLITNFILLQIFIMSLVCVIFNTQSYLSQLYVIILYSLFIIVDKYNMAFSFLFNDNNLFGGTIVLCILNILLFMLRNINKNLDYS